MTRPLSRDAAQAELNRCFERGSVTYTRHFRDELLADDFTIDDVLAVCRSGIILTAPEPDIRTGGWKYRIKGGTADRRRLAVVFITVFERSP